MWTMWWGERSVPAWAGVAAAVLILATGAAIANVQLRFSDGEVTLSTGWRSTSAITNSPETAARPDVALAPLSAAEWRQAIAQVEAELRTEIDAVRRSNTSVPSSAVLPSPDAALLRRIQSLITESEQRQREELALRFTQFTRDVEVQRRTDLVRIEQGFGQVEGRAGAEAARQRQLLNYLVRVSGQPPQ